MANYIVESYSVTACRVLDGITGAETVVGDLHGVGSASLEITKGSIEQLGEPGVMVPYEWFNYGTLTVSGGFISLQLVEKITGEKIVDYVTEADYLAGNALDPSDPDYADNLAIAQNSPEHVFEQQWLSEKMFNSPSVPVLIRRAAQDSSKDLRLMDYVLYRVFLSPPVMSGQDGAFGPLWNFTGRVVMSTVDEKGNSLGTYPNGMPRRASGRIVSRKG